MKKIIILATGGTIAGTGDKGKSAGYEPGALGVRELTGAVPGLSDIARIGTFQVCNINSDDITGEIWLKLAGKINELAEDPDTDGFVVTHGTDTLEETAYFLNLTVRSGKPVVITGSMRPSTSLSPDGPMNLYEAVCTAASGQAAGKGVLAVFSDRIYSARSVTKRNTYHVSAIEGGETGAIGTVRDGAVRFYCSPERKHTLNSEFDISGLRRLPKVSVIYFSVDEDPALLKFAADRSDGIVIAGAGAGEFSRSFAEAIRSLRLPAVISSRTGDGIIVPENLLCENTIAGDSLPPQKAAVLLRLALTRTDDRDEIRRMFAVY